MSSIAIVGAGITGITTAYKLNRQGHQVTVFDRHPRAAMETSFANGGQLSASNAEVWNHPRTFFKGVKWMLRKDAPLLVHPSPSWHKLSWLFEFVLAARSYEANTVATTRLALAARWHLTEMAEEEGIAFDMERRGLLHFYETEAEFQYARRANRLLARGGLQRRAVGPDEIRAIEPALTGSYVGGYYTESDFSGDIHAFTTGLAEAVRRRGARLAFEHDVLELRREGDGGVLVRGQQAGEAFDARFEAVVVCAGVASRRFAAQLDDRLNIYPVKGYSVTVSLKDEDSRRAAPWVSLLDEEAKIVTSRLGRDRFRVAGTAELAGENRDIRSERIRPLVDWCRRRFPAMSTEDVLPWAGLRPMMPDMMPRVGRGRAAGVFYNTGHGHLGWTLSAATADMIAAEVTEAFRRPTHAGAALKGTRAAA